MWSWNHNPWLFWSTCLPWNISKNRLIMSWHSNVTLLQGSSSYPQTLVRLQWHDWASKSTNAGKSPPTWIHLVTFDALNHLMLLALDGRASTSQKRVQISSQSSVALRRLHRNKWQSTDTLSVSLHDRRDFLSECLKDSVWMHCLWCRLAWSWLQRWFANGVGWIRKDSLRLHGCYSV